MGIRENDLGKGEDGKREYRVEHVDRSEKPEGKKIGFTDKLKRAFHNSMEKLAFWKSSKEEVNLEEPEFEAEEATHGEDGKLDRGNKHKGMPFGDDWLTRSSSGVTRGGPRIADSGEAPSDIMDDEKEDGDPLIIHLDPKSGDMPEGVLSAPGTSPEDGGEKLRDAKRDLLTSEEMEEWNKMKQMGEYILANFSQEELDVLKKYKYGNESDNLHDWLGKMTVAKTITDPSYSNESTVDILVVAKIFSVYCGRAGYDDFPFMNFTKFRYSYRISFLDEDFTGSLTMDLLRAKEKSRELDPEQLVDKLTSELRALSDFFSSLSVEEKEAFELLKIGESKVTGAIAAVSLAVNNFSGVIDQIKRNDQLQRELSAFFQVVQSNKVYQRYDNMPSVDSIMKLGFTIQEPLDPRLVEACFTRIENIKIGQEVKTLLNEIKNNRDIATSGIAIEGESLDNLLEDQMLKQLEKLEYWKDFDEEIPNARYLWGIIQVAKEGGMYDEEKYPLLNHLMSAFSMETSITYDEEKESEEVDELTETEVQHLQELLKIKKYLLEHLSDSEKDVVSTKEIIISNNTILSILDSINPESIGEITQKSKIPFRWKILSALVHEMKAHAEYNNIPTLNEALFTGIEPKLYERIRLFAQEKVHELLEARNAFTAEERAEFAKILDMKKDIFEQFSPEELDVLKQQIIDSIPIYSLLENFSDETTLQAKQGDEMTRKYLACIYLFQKLNASLSKTITTPNLSAFRERFKLKDQYIAELTDKLQKAKQASLARLAKENDKGMLDKEKQALQLIATMDDIVTFFSDLPINEQKIFDNIVLNSEGKTLREGTKDMLDEEVLSTKHPYGSGASFIDRIMEGNQYDTLLAICSQLVHANEEYNVYDKMPAVDSIDALDLKVKNPLHEEIVERTFERIDDLKIASEVGDLLDSVLNTKEIDTDSIILHKLAFDKVKDLLYKLHKDLNYHADFEAQDDLSKIVAGLAKIAKDNGRYDEKIYPHLSRLMEKYPIEDVEITYGGIEEGQDAQAQEMLVDAMGSLKRLESLSDEQYEELKNNIDTLKEKAKSQSKGLSEKVEKQIDGVFHNFGTRDRQNFQGLLQNGLDMIQDKLISDKEVSENQLPALRAVLEALADFENSNPNVLNKDLDSGEDSILPDGYDEDSFESDKKLIKDHEAGKKSMRSIKQYPKARERVEAYEKVLAKKAEMQKLEEDEKLYEEYAHFIKPMEKKQQQEDEAAASNARRLEEMAEWRKRHQKRRRDEMKEKARKKRAKHEEERSKRAKAAQDKRHKEMFENLFKELDEEVALQKAARDATPDEVIEVAEKNLVGETRREAIDIIKRHSGQESTEKISDRAEGNDKSAPTSQSKFKGPSSDDGKHQPW